MVAVAHGEDNDCRGTRVYAVAQGYQVAHGARSAEVVPEVAAGTESDLFLYGV